MKDIGIVPPQLVGPEGEQLDAAKAVGAVVLIVEEVVREAYFVPVPCLCGVRRRVQTDEHLLVEKCGLGLQAGHLRRVVLILERGVAGRRAADGW